MSRHAIGSIKGPQVEIISEERVKTWEGMNSKQSSVERS